MIITEEVRTNCLATKADVGHHFVGKDVLISGWGVTKDGSDDVAITLQKVTRPVISDRDCEAVYDVLEPDLICIDTTGGHSPCRVSYFEKI
jgi:hypothetical protein